MEISVSSLAVFDDNLPQGTPLAYEIVGGSEKPFSTRGIVRIGEPEPLRLLPGVYEIRLVHPRRGRLVKTLDVGYEPEVVYFRDMESRLHEESRTTDAPRSSEASSPELSAALSMWREAGVARWHLIPDGPGPKVIGPNQWGIPAGCDADLVHVHLHHADVSLRIPWGASTLAIESGGRHVRVIARTDNARAEAMLDYMMKGYVEEADTVRDNAAAVELLDQELQSPAGAMIGAYYLLRTGEALEYVDWLRELAHNFPSSSDAWVVLACTLLHKDGNKEHVRQEAREILMHVMQLGLPAYREGVLLLREGLDWIRAGDQHDEEVASCIGAIRPYQAALRHDTTVAAWRCGNTPEPLVVRERDSASATADNDVELASG